MRILSIDASTKSSGWAIFEDTKLVDYGMVTASSTDLIKRIHKIVDGFDEILSKNQIDTVILEEVRPENGLQNIKTHRALMWLQGQLAVMIHDNHNNIPIEYFYPSEWRKVCGIKTGAGVRRTSLKPRDIAFVKETYGLDVNDDIADAIGIGYAFVHKLEEEINWE